MTPTEKQYLIDELTKQRDLSISRKCNDRFDIGFDQGETRGLNFAIKLIEGMTKSRKVEEKK